MEPKDYEDILRHHLGDANVASTQLTISPQTAQAPVNLSAKEVLARMDMSRDKLTWKDPFGHFDPREDAQRRQEQYERDRIEGMVGDMVRRRVRAELDRMNSTRTAMVQLEVCAEGGFTVVHNGSKYACADTQAMTERIVAITAVMALEQMDKEQP